MAKAQYVGVDGVARKAKKNYIGVDGIARKVKKAYVGVDGVARQCFSSDITWSKYSCDVSAQDNYIQDSSANGTEGSAYVGEAGVYYSGWQFDSSLGFSKSKYSTTKTFTEDYAGAVDHYYIWKDSDKQQVRKITSCSVLSEADSIYKYGYTIQSSATNNPTYTYSKGSTSYGTIAAPEGVLPEDGTLIEGSVEDGYCVIQTTDSIYYYILEG